MWSNIFRHLFCRLALNSMRIWFFSHTQKKSLRIFVIPQYVIKKLNLITSSKRERRAAEQEAQLLSQLRHPNIVTYRESWEGEDCQLYIVMGFCEGGDLYHRLKQQKGELLPERQVVEWFVQIAMALEVCWDSKKALWGSEGTSEVKRCAFAFVVSAWKKHSSPGPQNTKHLLDKAQHHQGWRPWYSPRAGKPEWYGQHTYRDPLLHESRALL